MTTKYFCDVTGEETDGHIFVIPTIAVEDRVESMCTEKGIDTEEMHLGSTTRSKLMAALKEIFGSLIVHNFDADTDSDGGD
jgi:hypothetical protein